MNKVVSPINTEATEYTLKVVLIFSPENFVITQKYASFACDIIIEPAPIDNTVSSLPFSLSSPSEINKGNTIDDAVIIATVDDPWAVFKMKVSRNGNRRPRLSRVTALLK